MSYGHDTHTRAHTNSSSKVSRQKIVWKQTDGQTDATDTFTFLANAVGKYVIIENSMEMRLICPKCDVTSNSGTCEACSVGCQRVCMCNAETIGLAFLK